MVNGMDDRPEFFRVHNAGILKAVFVELEQELFPIADPPRGSSECSVAISWVGPMRLKLSRVYDLVHEECRM